MLSFVIPAYNEELLIGATVDAIHAAANEVGEPYEIIVADDASTDGTVRVAASHGARVVATSNRQIAATRNAGVREAAGEYLIFVDADTVVREGAVRGAFEAMRTGAAGGGCAVEFEGRIPWHARALLGPMMFFYRRVGIASGSFVYCTRDVFDRIGGFDERYFAGEEVWFSRAIGKQGRFVFLRDKVATSGRKLRTYSAGELYRILLGLSLRGLRGVRKREGLDLWYGVRRVDPDGPAQHPEAGKPEGGAA